MDDIFLATLWTSSSFKVINFKVIHQKLEKLWKHKSNKQIQEKNVVRKNDVSKQEKSNCSPIMESKMDTTTSMPSSLASPHPVVDPLSQCFFETLVSSWPLLSRLLRSFQKLMSCCSPIAKHFEVSLLKLNVDVFSLSQCNI